LKPVFRPNGTITAGNAPGLNDAAAAMVLADGAWAEKRGLAPTARLVSYGIAAVEPGMFGLGPIPAVRQALQRARWDIGSIERVEINEAFAAIAIVVAREASGAVAHGHPIGATGAAHHETYPLDAARRPHARPCHAVHRRRPRYRARHRDDRLMPRRPNESGLPLAGGVVGAGSELDWPNPTRPSDTLHVESEVLDIRPSRSRPDRGVATVQSLTRNQRNEVVQRLTAKLVVLRRV
jgi:hypothetical protein